MKLFTKPDLIIKKAEDENGNEFTIRFHHSMSPVVKSAYEDQWVTLREIADIAKAADDNKDFKAQIDIIRQQKRSDDLVYASFIAGWDIDGLEFTHDNAVSLIENNPELVDFIKDNCFKKEAEYNAKKNSLSSGSGTTQD